MNIQQLADSASEAATDQITAALAEIRGLHGEIMQAARRSLDQAIRIGELLRQLKKRCGHGNWLVFAKNLPFCVKTAENYMRVDREQRTLKSANVADLKLTAAYLRLAESEPAHPAHSNRSADAQERQPVQSPRREPASSAKEDKASRITVIGRAVLEKLERLSLEDLTRFAADLFAFKETWMREHCPELIGNELRESGKGGRQ